MRFTLAIGLAAVVSGVWSAPVLATCSPLPSATAPDKCTQTSDEGLCRANPECNWDEPVPAAPAETKPKQFDDTSKEIIKLQNPLSETKITAIVGRAIKAAMGIMGSLALVVFVYGGFRWLTAAGNSEHIEAGTGAMVWATIGIFIIFSSYAILQLVFNAIGAQNRGTATPVTGGAGGLYCLINCTEVNSCETISQAAGSDFEALEKKCSQPNYSIEKKNCTEVAVCKK